MLPIWHNFGLLRGPGNTLYCCCSRDYPSDPACYELLEDCGRGVSATVHRAFCKTSQEIVAVKKMNLERVNMKLVRTPPSMLAEQTTTPAEVAAALAGPADQQQGSNRAYSWHWQL